MADFKRQMSRHLQSAKVWLTRAEESFDKDSTVRGELDLLLAQAELQRARETSLPQPRWYSGPLMRQALSFVFAITIISTGFGAYWLVSERTAAIPVPLAAPEIKAAPVAKVASEPAAPVQVEDQRPATPKVTSTTPSETVAPVSARPEKTERVQPAEKEKENLLSPDEMQKIIRAAGKSLRGQ
jgi:type IV secretory pathway VirB10-like protein